VRRPCRCFYNRLNDLIDFYFTGDFNTSTYRNINAAETAGVGLAETGTLLPGTLSSTVSYTYLLAENLVTGLPLRRRRAHWGKVAFTCTGVPGLEATLATTLVGSRPDNDADTVVLAPYARVDLYATYHVSPSLSIFGRVENLFDTKYEEVSGYNAAGLSAYVGLKWSN
jgi:vitamin B12 transporter